ncbi:hypothetical protein ABW19_dt0203610 [Dactylella cylindrospora]|nr:hypothetical protein ABW19_dt0203610 [Dactylella cylindrospora]
MILDVRPKRKREIRDFLRTFNTPDDDFSQYYLPRIPHEEDERHPESQPSPILPFYRSISTHNLNIDSLPQIPSSKASPAAVDIRSLPESEISHHLEPTVEQIRNPTLPTPPILSHEFSLPRSVSSSPQSAQFATLSEYWEMPTLPAEETHSPVSLPLIPIAESECFQLDRDIILTSGGLESDRDGPAKLPGEEPLMGLSLSKFAASPPYHEIALPHDAGSVSSFPLHYASKDIFTSELPMSRPVTVIEAPTLRVDTTVPAAQIFTCNDTALPPSPSFCSMQSLHHFSAPPNLPVSRPRTPIHESPVDIATASVESRFSRDQDPARIALAESEIVDDYSAIVSREIDDDFFELPSSRPVSSRQLPVEELSPVLASVVTDIHPGSVAQTLERPLSPHAYSLPSAPSTVSDIPIPQIRSLGDPLELPASRPITPHPVEEAIPAIPEISIPAEPMASERNLPESRPESPDLAVELLPLRGLTHSALLSLPESRTTTPGPVDITDPVSLDLDKNLAPAVRELESFPFVKLPSSASSSPRLATFVHTDRDVALPHSVIFEDENLAGHIGAGVEPDHAYIQFPESAPPSPISPVYNLEMGPAQNVLESDAHSPVLLATQSIKALVPMDVEFPRITSPSIGSGSLVAVELPHSRRSSIRIPFGNMEIPMLPASRPSTPDPLVDLPIANVDALSLTTDLPTLPEELPFGPRGVDIHIPFPAAGAVPLPRSVIADSQISESLPIAHSQFAILPESMMLPISEMGSPSTMFPQRDAHPPNYSPPSPLHSALEDLEGVETVKPLSITALPIPADEFALPVENDATPRDSPLLRPPQQPGQLPRSEFSALGLRISPQLVDSDALYPASTGLPSSVPGSPSTISLGYGARRILSLPHSVVDASISQPTMPTGPIDLSQSPEVDDIQAQLPYLPLSATSSIASLGFHRALSAAPSLPATWLETRERNNYPVSELQVLDPNYETASLPPSVEGSEANLFVRRMAGAEFHGLPYSRPQTPIKIQPGPRGVLPSPSNKLERETELPVSPMSSIFASAEGQDKPYYSLLPHSHGASPAQSAVKLPSVVSVQPEEISRSLPPALEQHILVELPASPSLQSVDPPGYQQQVDATLPLSRPATIIDSMLAQTSQLQSHQPLRDMSADLVALPDLPGSPVALQPAFEAPLERGESGIFYPGLPISHTGSPRLAPIEIEVPWSPERSCSPVQSEADLDPDTTDSILLEQYPALPMSPPLSPKVVRKVPSLSPLYRLKEAARSFVEYPGLPSSHAASPYVYPVRLDSPIDIPHLSRDLPEYQSPIGSKSAAIPHVELGMAFTKGLPQSPTESIQAEFGVYMRSELGSLPGSRATEVAAGPHEIAEDAPTNNLDVFLAQKLPASLSSSPKLPAAQDFVLDALPPSRPVTLYAVPQNVYRDGELPIEVSVTGYSAHKFPLPSSGSPSEALGFLPSANQSVLAVPRSHSNSVYHAPFEIRPAMPRSLGSEFSLPSSLASSPDLLPAGRIVANSLAPLPRSRSSSIGFHEEDPILSVSLPLASPVLEQHILRATDSFKPSAALPRSVASSILEFLPAPDDAFAIPVDLRSNFTSVNVPQPYETTLLPHEETALPQSIPSSPGYAALSSPGSPKNIPLPYGEPLVQEYGSRSEEHHSVSALQDGISLPPSSFTPSLGLPDNIESYAIAIPDAASSISRPRPEIRSTEEIPQNIHTVQPQLPGSQASSPDLLPSLPHYPAFAIPASPSFSTYALATERANKPPNLDLDSVKSNLEPSHAQPEASIPRSSPATVFSGIYNVGSQVGSQVPRYLPSSRPDSPIAQRYQHLRETSPVNLSDEIALPLPRSPGVPSFGSGMHYPEGELSLPESRSQTLLVSQQKAVRQKEYQLEHDGAELPETRPQTPTMSHEFQPESGLQERLPESHLQSPLQPFRDVKPYGPSLPSVPVSPGPSGIADIPESLNYDNSALPMSVLGSPYTAQSRTREVDIMSIPLRANISDLEHDLNSPIYYSIPKELPHSPRVGATSPHVTSVTDSQLPYLPQSHPGSPSLAPSMPHMSPIAVPEYYYKLPTPQQSAYKRHLPLDRLLTSYPNQGDNINLATSKERKPKEETVRPVVAEVLDIEEFLVDASLPSSPIHEPLAEESRNLENGHEFLVNSATASPIQPAIEEDINIQDYLLEVPYSPSSSGVVADSYIPEEHLAIPQLGVDEPEYSSDTVQALPSVEEATTTEVPEVVLPTPSATFSQAEPSPVPEAATKPERPSNETLYEPPAHIDISWPIQERTPLSSRWSTPSVPALTQDSGSRGVSELEPSSGSISRPPKGLNIHFSESDALEASPADLIDELIPPVSYGTLETALKAPFDVIDELMPEAPTRSSRKPKDKNRTGTRPDLPDEMAGVGLEEIPHDEILVRSPLMDPVAASQPPKQDSPVPAPSIDIPTIVKENDIVITQSPESKLPITQEHQLVTQKAPEPLPAVDLPLFPLERNPGLEAVSAYSPPPVSYLPIEDYLAVNTEPELDTSVPSPTIDEPLYSVPSPAVSSKILLPADTDPVSTLPFEPPLSPSSLPSDGEHRTTASEGEEEQITLVRAATLVNLPSPLVEPPESPLTPPSVKDKGKAPIADASESWSSGYPVTGFDIDEGLLLEGDSDNEIHFDFVTKQPQFSENTVLGPSKTVRFADSPVFQEEFAEGGRSSPVESFSWSVPSVSAESHIPQYTRENASSLPLYEAGPSQPRDIPVNFPDFIPYLPDEGIEDEDIWDDRDEGSARALPLFSENASASRPRSRDAKIKDFRHSDISRTSKHSLRDSDPIRLSSLEKIPEKLLGLAQDPSVSLKPKPQPKLKQQVPEPLILPFPKETGARVTKAQKTKQSTEGVIAKTHQSQEEQPMRGRLAERHIEPEGPGFFHAKNIPSETPLKNRKKARPERRKSADAIDFSQEATGVRLVPEKKKGRKKALNVERELSLDNTDDGGGKRRQRKSEKERTQQHSTKAEEFPSRKHVPKDLPIRELPQEYLQFANDRKEVYHSPYNPPNNRSRSESPTTREVAANLALKPTAIKGKEKKHRRKEKRASPDRRRDYQFEGPIGIQQPPIPVPRKMYEQMPPADLEPSKNLQSVVEQDVLAPKVVELRDMLPEPQSHGKATVEPRQEYVYHAVPYLPQHQTRLVPETLVEQPRYVPEYKPTEIPEITQAPAKKPHLLEPFVPQGQDSSFYPQVSAEQRRYEVELERTARLGREQRAIELLEEQDEEAANRERQRLYLLYRQQAERYEREQRVLNEMSDREREDNDKFLYQQYLVQKQQDDRYAKETELRDRNRQEDMVIAIERKKEAERIRREEFERERRRQEEERHREYELAQERAAYLERERARKEEISRLAVELRKREEERNVLLEQQRLAEERHQQEIRMLADEIQRRDTERLAILEDQEIAEQQRKDEVQRLANEIHNREIYRTILVERKEDKERIKESIRREDLERQIIEARERQAALENQERLDREVAEESHRRRLAEAAALAALAEPVIGSVVDSNGSPKSNKHRFLVAGIDDSPQYHRKPYYEGSVLTYTASDASSIHSLESPQPSHTHLLQPPIAPRLSSESLLSIAAAGLPYPRKAAPKSIESLDPWSEDNTPRLSQYELAPDSRSRIGNQGDVLGSPRTPIQQPLVEEKSAHKTRNDLLHKDNDEDAYDLPTTPTAPQQSSERVGLGIHVLDPRQSSPPGASLPTYRTDSRGYLHRIGLEETADPVRGIHRDEPFVIPKQSETSTFDADDASSVVSRKNNHAQSALPYNREAPVEPPKQPEFAIPQQNLSIPDPEYSHPCLPESRPASSHTNVLPSDANNFVPLPGSRRASVIEGLETGADIMPPKDQRTNLPDTLQPQHIELCLDNRSVSLDHTDLLHYDATIPSLPETVVRSEVPEVLRDLPVQLPSPPEETLFLQTHPAYLPASRATSFFEPPPLTETQHFLPQSRPVSPGYCDDDMQMETRSEFNFDDFEDLPPSDDEDGEQLVEMFTPHRTDGFNLPESRVSSLYSVANALPHAPHTYLREDIPLPDLQDDEESIDIEGLSGRVWKSVQSLPLSRKDSTSSFKSTTPHANEVDEHLLPIPQTPSGSDGDILSVRKIRGSAISLPLTLHSQANETSASAKLHEGESIPLPYDAQSTLSDVSSALQPRNRAEDTTDFRHYLPTSRASSQCELHNMVEETFPEGLPFLRENDVPSIYTANESAFVPRYMPSEAGKAPSSGRTSPYATSLAIARSLFGDIPDLPESDMQSVVMDLPKEGQPCSPELPLSRQSSLYLRDAQIPQPLRDQVATIETPDSRPSSSHTIRANEPHEVEMELPISRQSSLYLGEYATHQLHREASLVRDLPESRPSTSYTALHTQHPQHDVRGLPLSRQSSIYLQDEAHKSVTQRNTNIADQSLPESRPTTSYSSNVYAADDTLNRRSYPLPTLPASRPVTLTGLHSPEEDEDITPRPSPTQIAREIGFQIPGDFALPISQHPSLASLQDYPQLASPKRTQDLPESRPTSSYTEIAASFLHAKPIPQGPIERVGERIPTPIGRDASPTLSTAAPENSLALVPHVPSEAFSDARSESGLHVPETPQVLNSITPTEIEEPGEPATVLSPPHTAFRQRSPSPRRQRGSSGTQRSRRHRRHRTAIQDYEFRPLTVTTTDNDPHAAGIDVHFDQETGTIEVSWSEDHFGEAPTVDISVFYPGDTDDDFYGSDYSGPPSAIASPHLTSYNPENLPRPIEASTREDELDLFFSPELPPADQPIEQLHKAKPVNRILFPEASSDSHSRGIGIDGLQQGGSEVAGSLRAQASKFSSLPNRRTSLPTISIPETTRSKPSEVSPVKSSLVLESVPSSVSPIESSVELPPPSPIEQLPPSVRTSPTQPSWPKSHRRSTFTDEDNKALDLLFATETTPTAKNPQSLTQHRQKRTAPVVATPGPPRLQPTPRSGGSAGRRNTNTVEGAYPSPETSPELPPQPAKSPDTARSTPRLRRLSTSGSSSRRNSIGKRYPNLGADLEPLQEDIAVVPSSIVEKSSSISPKPGSPKATPPILNILKRRGTMDPLREEFRSSLDGRMSPQALPSEANNKPRTSTAGPRTRSSANLGSPNPMTTPGSPFRYDSPTPAGGSRKGKERAAQYDSGEVYEAFGDTVTTPLSPERPISVNLRKRQSIQLMDLESRIRTLNEQNVQLSNEVARLQEESAGSEKNIEALVYKHLQERSALVEALEIRSLAVSERESQIETLKKNLEWYKQEDDNLAQQLQQLRITNEQLAASEATQRQQYERKREQLHSLSQQHSDLQEQYAELSSGLNEIINQQITKVAQLKDAEIEKLKQELATAKSTANRLQVKLNAMNRYIDAKDEVYFARSCGHLFNAVQQWCVKFSKFSDAATCVAFDAIADESVKDLVESVVLDGSDVKAMLRDRVRRREIFMAMTMALIWELIFCRYLFGLEADERKKLKALEEKLNEVGPPAAVHMWRATTLQLLSQRRAFRASLPAATEPVVQEIYRSLRSLLPPPFHLEQQVVDSLRNVINLAVTLSIDMRTQRAEYFMWEAPDNSIGQPIEFVALRMNNRGNEGLTNDQLEQMGAIVRVVLFPLVTKRGDENGDNYDVETVIAPMQVLVSKKGGSGSSAKRVKLDSET